MRHTGARATFTLGLLLLAGTALAQEYPFNRTRGREYQRTRESSISYAAFEAFPTSGAGTFGACSTTPPTGARGEVLTSTRASSATCTKTASGGLATTGIADGDLVSLTSNTLRAEWETGGAGLAVLLEAQGINSLPRSDQICNVAWVDVGTPDCTADATTGPWGTTTMARLTDNAAGAAEGRAQTIATTSATRYTAFCYVKGGTATSATFNLIGTGNAAGDCGTTISGLSTTTSSIVSCTSAVAYTGAVTAAQLMLRVGTVVADQGTLFVEGCDVVVNSTYVTSHIPTVAAAATRVTDTPPVASFTPSAVATGSMSLRVELLKTATDGLLCADATGAFKQGIIGFGGQRAYVGAVSKVGPLAAFTAGAHTGGIWWDGSSTTLVLDGASTAGAAGTPVATNQIIIGGYNGSNLEPGLYSRIKYDTTTTRGLP